MLLLAFSGFRFNIKAQDGLDTLKDVEGNSYRTVQIGTQLWMAENLRATKFNDGQNIPLITSAAWYSHTGNCYCWYSNNPSAFGNPYGALYNWYTINTGKLCPQGWHVPSDSDWVKLRDYLGGETVAGSKLKETGTDHWNPPNTGATNETGFTALPGGGRWMIGRFDLLGRNGYLWSSTEDLLLEAVAWRMGSSQNSLERVGTLKKNGFNVRCLKD